MKTFNTRAVVLKSINYGDSDKIFTLLTKDMGKISASARGVRKISSKRRGSLDTLNLVDLKIYDGSNGYRTIQETEIINSFSGMKKNIERTFSGYYLSELINKNIQEDHHDSIIYDLFVKSLKMLSDPRVPNKLAVAYFEIHFMRSQGYEIEFEACINCKRKFDSSWGDYKFKIFPAGFLCDKCGYGDYRISDNTAEILHKLSKNIFSFKIDSKTLSEINFILKTYLEETLGEKIKTLEIKL